MVWINPAAAWESAVDAAAELACDEVVLLLVTEQAAALFDEAEARIGRPERRLWERGPPAPLPAPPARGPPRRPCLRDGAPGLPVPSTPSRPWAPSRTQTS